MGKKTNMVSGGFDYFFVKPAPRKDVHKAARKLMDIKGVSEVSVTEGEYGFIVKADFFDERDNDFLCKEILKAVGGRSSKAACHYKYRK